jgi:hypothetical protein
MDIANGSINETTPARTKRRLAVVAALAGSAAIASVATVAASSGSSSSSPPPEPFRTIVVTLKAGLGESAYKSFEARYSTDSFPAVTASYEQSSPLGTREAWLYVDYGASQAQYQSLTSALHRDPRVAQVRVESFSPIPDSASGCSSGQGSATSTTAPWSGGTQPQVVADLRPGTSGALSGYLVSGPVGAMAGISGSSWNYSAPLRAFFKLSCDATVGQVGQVEAALRQYPFVQAVEVSIAG